MFVCLCMYVCTVQNRASEPWCWIYSSTALTLLFSFNLAKSLRQCFYKNNKQTNKALLLIESLTRDYWYCDHSLPSHHSSFLSQCGGHTATILETKRWEQKEDDLKSSLYYIMWAFHQPKALIHFLLYVHLSCGWENGYAHLFPH